MKISFNWLKDYVDTKLKPKELADKLTMAGTEVTSTVNIGGDTILEMEVTSNRPDCLSLIGIAREVAAITGKKLKIPKIKNSKTRSRKGLKPSSIQIQDKKGCLRYIGILIKDVEVKGSPDWLKKRLEALGLRPVNNIVDITNFCLLEWGQPLHAFDFDKLLNNKIIVRRAKKDEKIITIDGEVRSLDPEILVIADSQKPVAIAGVMGGTNTEVTNNTKNILIESAYFDPITIRHAARKLGLSSESSYRFERTVDVEGVELAALRAADLISKLAKGKFVNKLNIQTKNLKQDRRIKLDTERLNSILGIQITAAQIKTIFSRLGFNVTKAKKQSMEVRVPSFRQDVGRAEDLIEEAARIFGYQNIPLTLPSIKPFQIQPQLLSELKDILRKDLIAHRLNEIMSYSLISKGQLKKCNLDSLDAIEVANPLSREQEILRPTSVTGLLSCIDYNLSRNIENIKIFELSNIFEKAEEISVLSIAVTGAKHVDWKRKIEDNFTFFDLKGIIESLVERLGIDDYVFIQKNLSLFNDGHSVTLNIRDKEIGFLGKISREVLDSWDIKKDNIFVAQINLDRLLEFVDLDKKFRPLALHPSIKRDISFLIRQDSSSDDIMQIIRKEAGVFLKDIRLIDFYQGQQIPSNFKSLTYSLEYQADDRTLKDDEINVIQERIIQALESQLEVRVRR